MRRSALASTCISLSAALVRAGDAPPDPGRVATLELEAGLAKQPGVYLVLDPPRKVLEVKSRGIVLDTVRLDGIEVVGQGAFLGSPDLPALTAPSVWTIKSGAGDTDREVIAPAELRPYPKDGEEEEAEAPAAANAAPTPTATPIPEPPLSYRARLDSGWDLWVCEDLPPRGFVRRFFAALRDGWDRLRGGGEDYPPTVALEMAPEDARRIHHLVRSGTRILLAAGAT